MIDLAERSERRFQPPPLLDTVARAGERLAPWLALGLGVAFWLACSWLVVVRLDSYHFEGTRPFDSADLARYANYLWNTAEGRPFASTLLRHNRSILAEHVPPVLVPLALLYRLLPDPRWLVALQQAALALSGLPIYLLARARLGGPWPALAALASYYLAPNLARAAAIGGFWPVGLTVVPLAFGAYYLLTGRERLGVVVASCTLLVEETSALALLGLGLMLFARRSRVAGAALTGLAVAWLALATLVIMPAFHLEETLPDSGNRTLEKFAALWEAPGATLPGLLTLAASAALWLLLPTAGLGLLAPSALLAGLPTSAVLLLVENGKYLQSHRVVAALPLLWLAAVEGAARLPGRRRWLAALLMLGLSAGAFVRAGDLPGGGDFDSRQTRWDTRSETMARALAAVPPDASVAATRRALVHLANREHVYLFPDRYSNDALWPGERVQWFVVDVAGEGQQTELVEVSNSPLREREPYDIWLLHDDLLVATDTLPAVPPVDGPVFGAKLRLRGYQAWIDGATARVRLLWEAERAPRQEYVRRLELVDAAGAPLVDDRGPASLSYFGTDRWKAGQRVLEDLSLPLDASATVAAGARLTWETLESGDPLPLQDGSRSATLPLRAPG